MDALDFTPPKDDFEREERCRKTMKAVGRAIVMRLVVLVLLILVCARGTMNLWGVGILLLVAAISLAAIFPLLKEWKLRRAELKEILDSQK